MNFVICGGGPTGVEMAGAIAEIARETLARIFVISIPRPRALFSWKGTSVFLSSFPRIFGECAKTIAGLGVEVMTEWRAENMTENGVEVAGKSFLRVKIGRGQRGFFRRLKR